MAKKPVQAPPLKQAKQLSSGSAQPNETALAHPKTAIDNMVADDVGLGLESMSPEDYAIPRLSILQALSPQVNKRDDAYVEGAEVGAIYENVSNRVFDNETGILMLLVSYRRAHLQWWPRDAKAGKGFIKDHGPDPAILSKTKRNDKGQNLMPDGSEIVPTAEYFGFLINEEDGTYERFVISMSKTQMIKAKKLNTMASQFTVDVPGKGRQVAPLFYRSYRFRTKPESNEHGNWFGWDIEPGPIVTQLKNGEQMYMDARNFRASILSGNIKVADPNADAGGEQTTQHADDNAPM